MFNLNLQNTTETQLKKLLALYDGDEECFAQKIIADQTAELKKIILGLHLDLLAFEHQHQNSSEHFYTQYQSGKLGDEEEFML